MKNLLKVSENEVYFNARVKYLPNDDGEYIAKSMTVFDRPMFKDGDFELSDDCGRKKKSGTKSPIPDEENRRKAYMRARNNLFDILLSTLSFDCFVTLTLNPDEIDRTDYKAVMDKLRVWLDNRVRRNGLVYTLVPERHKSGAIHFHGLMNFSALKTARAVNNNKDSKYYLQPLVDNNGREVYNILDFKLGFSTVINLSGDNAREATAKYCYKYIMKSGGEKIGGRYYLSGGELGRPRYELLTVDIENVGGKEIDLKYAKMKRVNL